jgi:hypothetical protein
MKAYTDYPLYIFNDEPYKEAPVREAHVISYDGNKYCIVAIGGHIFEIKAGYLYKGPGRCGEVECIDPTGFIKEEVL